ncbi:eukaryotic translation initiation factor 2 subunit 2-like [Limulus polyphemus]|uniref:Eukaryotic translation initiation factor 2 subunit 2 n=1 Tax=Limulus polyphemus TaxID=6850 RepID=A0ABM1BB90_LIMPO|nr:eukaryotic translation initiation factor 2 subunit 2-like [Limulus polyphemus]
MADDEAIFDPTMKKKKKKKRTPFDLGSGIDDGPTTVDNTPVELKVENGVEKEDPDKENKDNEDRENKDDDAPLDLDDFTGVKKKKKKKKVFGLDELESALPNLEPKEEQIHQVSEEKDDDLGGLDEDLDFSLPKKKKKKKKISFDELEVDSFPQDEDEDTETTFELEGETKTSTVAAPGLWIGTDRDYTYDELLNRVFNIMREKNPDMVAGEKRRFVMRPPQVIRVGTKKTSFANFLEICKMLHRQPKHLQAFLLAELGTSGSVDANSQLIIKGRFQQKQIENVLRRYIKEYVTCHTCRSPDTILQKDTRLFFLQCETCGSRCSVASIKSGFQAVTGKRAAIRAKNA